MITLVLRSYIPGSFLFLAAVKVGALPLVPVDVVVDIVDVDSTAVVGDSR